MRQQVEEAQQTLGLYAQGTENTKKKHVTLTIFKTSRLFAEWKKKLKLMSSELP